ncbi:UbiA prenyltransferase family protein [Chryseobacterium sp. A301]
MKLSSRLKTYLIDSQLFVSLMGTLFAVFFMVEQNAFRLPSVVLIFVTYLSGYLYTKYQGQKKMLSKILVLNIVTFLVSALFIILNHNEIRLLKWLIIVLLGLLYNSTFLDDTVRKVPLLKIFYVGLVWALVNAWLFSEPIDWPIFFMSWLYITALVLPFDIRDLPKDHVLTLPKLIGIENTKKFAYLLLFLSSLCASYFLSFTYAFCFFVSGLIAGVLIYYSSPSRKDSYFSFWVELCSGLPFLFLILMEYF